MTDPDFHNFQFSTLFTLDKVARAVGRKLVVKLA